MKYIFFIISLSIIQITYQKFCYPFSKLNSDEYKDLFPILNESFRNTSIILKINDFDKTQKKGEGGQGIVKLLSFSGRNGKQIQLAVKKIQINKNEIEQLDREMEFQLRLQQSKYIPKLWGCFGDQGNRKDSKNRVYYILQDPLNFDMAQNYYTYFNGRPIKNLNEIKQQLNFQKRLVFFQDLFKALVDMKQAGIVHNDIKPQNIMVGSKGYKSHPYIIDFGLAGQINSKPIHSTRCYEYKGKYFVKNLNSKMDVYSMGVTILELQLSYDSVCHFIINYQDIYQNYDTWSITEDQVLLFEQRILNILGFEKMKPSVPKVQDCQNLNCIILFTLQRYINKIPEPEDVVEALQNMIDMNQANRLDLL